MSNQKDPQLIVALDVDTFDEAQTLIELLSEQINIFKIGMQLFTACGPVIVRHVLSQGKKVFLDLKFHDIPNTVANAVCSAIKLSLPIYKVLNNKQWPDDGLHLLTLHTVGGEEMLKTSLDKGRAFADKIGVKPPLFLGVTVLTSESKSDNISDIVLQRALLAKTAGLDGIVASSQESSMIRKELGEDFLIITPGIRPEGQDAGDQKRVSTPKNAIINGSDFLVVGRPIVKAKDPVKAADALLQEIKV